MNNELVEAVARQLAFELTYSLGDRALHAAARKAIALIRPATLAEAAKVADDGAEREAIEARRHDASDPHSPFSMHAYRAAGWRDAAAAIRALKDEA